MHEELTKVCEIRSHLIKSADETVKDPNCNAQMFQMLGMAVDMIKDLAETEFYMIKTKEMKDRHMTEVTSTNVMSHHTGEAKM